VGEDIRVASPVAMLHYEFYTDENDLKEKLKSAYLLLLEEF
jgi:hypothetical protein